MPDDRAPVTASSPPPLCADATLRLRPTEVAARDGGMRRRTALTGLTGVAAWSVAMGLSTPADGPSSATDPGRGALAPRYLSLVVTHTGESFADVFAEGDSYDAQKLTRLNKLLRDYASGETKPIDPALFTVLARVHAEIGQPLRVLSGYRSWRNNRFMRLVGYDVAENSQHVAGKAVDFMVTGVTAAKLGEIARRCGAGGVGIYRSGFVHVDTGPVRSWTGEEWTQRVAAVDVPRLASVNAWDRPRRDETTLRAMICGWR
jgi:uncharacterized protein YcbK (DUF882 family)